MRLKEKEFIVRCKGLDPKDRKKLSAALHHMMDVDLEGLFYGLDDRPTILGLLVDDFTKLIRGKL